MSYTKTTWLEHGMNTAAKLTALDSLEGMYSEAVSYIDAITHAASYYTDAQAAAIFFGSGSDGSGSGLVAATLDGYTAEQIMAAGSPSGVICWWSGSEASIPSGWYLCNGLNGTPDLRNRFVVGAGSHYTKAESGGANTVTTSAAVTIADHTLTAGEIAKHGHGNITDYYGTGSSGTDGYAYQPTAVPGTSETSRETGLTGGGGAHGHAGSTFAGTSDQDKMVPFYALCFIMKG